MHTSNILANLLGFTLAQVIISFGIIALWNPIIRASKSEDVLLSLKSELHWLAPTYLIIKIIENSIIVSTSFTKDASYIVTSTISATILAALFSIAASYIIKAARNPQENSRRDSQFK